MYAVAATTLVLGVIASGGAYFSARARTPSMTKRQHRSLVFGLVGAVMLGLGVVLALLTYFDRS